MNASFPIPYRSVILIACTAVVLLGTLLPFASASAQATCTGSDIEQRVASGGNISLHSTQNGGQTFTAPCTGAITAVEVHVGGSVTGTLEIRLGAGSGGSLLGSTPFSFSSNGWVRFNFSSPVAVAGGTTYTIYFRHTSGSGILTYNDTNAYAGGNEILLGGSLDLVFAVDLEPVPGSGTGFFVDTGQILGASNNSGVATADLDGDGDLDLFFANTSDPNSNPTGADFVFVNDGSGTFTDSGQRLGLGLNSSNVDLGDIDGDGDIDAVTSSTESGIWVNDGMGSFSRGTLLIGFLRDARLADFDRDGDLDLAASSGAVLLNDGAGNFSNTGQVLSDAFSLDVADLDRDGDVDIVAVHKDTGGHVWLNDGSGVFAAGAAFTDGLMRRVALADLDGDGDVDAYVGQINGDGDRVFLNDGSGVFTMHGSRLANEDAHDVSLFDVDGDGDRDALVSNTTTGTMLWQNDGTGTLTDSGQLLLPGGGGVQLADVDGDGDPDAVVGSFEARIWENVARNTFYVTTAADNGATSLRQAIMDANATPNPLGVVDQIRFNIPDPGPHTILLQSALPPIEEAVMIDGTSQPGAACGADIPSRTLQIALDGTSAGGSGLRFIGGSDGSSVHGLVVHSFAANGIEMANTHGNAVTCSFIGTDATGMFNRGNGGNGMQMAGSTSNTIGGASGGEGNLISGNIAHNVHFEPGGDDNVVQGNFIGTNRLGTAVIGATVVGVGSNQGSGNLIGGTAEGAGNVIAGAAIAGIELAGAPATGNVIAGNLIGTDHTGLVPLPNAQGILVQGGAHTNTIGGTDVGARNVISGNTRGIVIAGSGASNLIIGNLVGTTPDGEGLLGNQHEGIIVYAGGTTIGGSDVASRNVISGNSAGIYVEGALGTVIEGNYIGTSAGGDAPLPNGLGMSIRFADQTRIGGTTVGAGNVISGNTGTGIGLRGGGTAIRGNIIGRAASGPDALPNLHGISIYDGGANTVGGLTPADGNTISGNSGDGIEMEPGAVNNSVLGNRIWDNGGLGIRLYPGANDGQSAPAITDAVYAGGMITISGTAGGSPGETLRVEFFANTSCDPSGMGEGRIFLGATNAVMDGSGQGTFNAALTDPGFPVRVPTATSTDADGNTSAFSPCAAPDISVPTGHVYAVATQGLAEPQGMLPDGSGKMLVSLTGSGQVVRIGSDGVLEAVVAFGLQRPAGMARAGQTLYVADAMGDAIHAIDLTAVPPGGVNVSTQGAFLSGLNGPSHLAVGPDGDLYASLTRGLVGEKIIRIDLPSTNQSDHVTFDDGLNVNPEGMAFAPNGDLYVALNMPGTVIRISANAALPVDGSALAPVFSGLEAPNALSFGPDGRLFIATRYGVEAARLGSNVPTAFVTGLAGGPFNYLVYDGVLLSVADGAAGRIIQVTSPRSQIVETMPLTFVLNTTALDAIGPDAANAARSAFAAWESVTGSDAAFIDGGTTADPTAGIDGVNKVTVDPTFPFPPLVLAIAAKTVVFGDTPGEGTITDADVVINPEFVNHRQYPIGTDAEPGAFDLQSIVTHEVGHVLGLVHSGVESATMYFVLQNGTEARTLTVDDQAWVGYRYPAASLPSVGSISGHITDGVTPGLHVGGALVLATNTSTGDAVHAYSDENGDYHIPMLPFGTYRVLIAPLSGTLRPANISAYLQTIANNLTFVPESWNDSDESADPNVDDPSAFVPVSVSAGITGIDFITNRDITPPVVGGVFPRSGATNVPVDSEILVTFSEPILENTLTLTLSTAGMPVSGGVVVVNSGRLGIFTPDAQLSHALPYEIRVASGLSDPSGNTLAADYTSTFTTSPPDLAAPGVEEIHPANNAVGVLTVEDVVVVFTEAVDALSLTAGMTLTGSLGPVAGTVALSLNNTVATFTPGARLEESTLYTLTLAPTVTDVSGNPLGGAGFTSYFVTGVETVAIVGVGPENNAGGVSVTTPILADFSAPIDVSELSTASFEVLQGGALQVPGTFEVLNAGTRVVFRPTAPLLFSTPYTINIPAGGLPDPGESGFLGSFTTAAAPQAPTIVSVSPPSAALGTTVVISGQGFDPSPTNVQVTFNGAPAAIAGATLTSITTTVPRTATSGPIVVTVGSTLSNAFPFEIAEPVAVTDEVVSKVTADAGTRDGDVSPDGTLAFVTNSGANSVSVINLVDTSVEETIPVGEMPLKIAVTPNGASAYVTNFKSNTVSVIDTELRSVAKTIAVGLNPIGVAITPDGTRAYVGEFTGKAISVIDIDPASGAANQVIARVTTDSGNRDVAISPDGTLMLATGTNGVTILSIDPGSAAYNQVIAKVTSDTGTRSAEISPDGTFGFVTTDAGEILVIDLNTSGSTPFQVIAKTTTDAGARDVTTSPDGTLIFATNFEGGTVTVYSFEVKLGATAEAVGSEIQPVTGLSITLTPVDVIEVGTDPEGIVFSPSAGLALVANTGSDDVSIIRFGVEPSPLPADRIAALTLDVEAMVAANELNGGHGAALLGHLNAAAKKLEKSDSEGAAKQLESFIKKVRGLLAKNAIPAAGGSALVDEAEGIVVELRSGAAKHGATEDDETLPTEFALAQNYPNPFSTSTRFEYDVPTERSSDRVELRVFDLLGRTILTLVDEDVAPGRYAVTWDGRREGGAFVASGVYLVQMRGGAFREVRKVVFVR